MRKCGSGRAGKATALQVVPDGFESHDPLAGVAQSVERELPKLEVAGSRLATRSARKREPNGKAPGWRPGTRETAWAFEPPRFRQGPLGEPGVPGCLSSSRARVQVPYGPPDWGVAQLEERGSLKSEAAGSKPATPAIAA